MRTLTECERVNLERLPLADPQRATVRRLMGKGWIDPFLYHRSVHLGLPMVALRRKFGSYTARDWHRPTIRVTPTGRILSDKY